MWTSLRQARRSTLTLATLTSLALFGAAPAPAQTAGTGWDLIGAITVTDVERNGTWTLVKDYPPGLTDGATLTVTGYFVPLVAQGYQSQFLLVPDPADCPYCGSGGYGPSLEVHVRRSLPDYPEGTLLTVTGVVELIPGPETYQTLRLRRAEWRAGAG